MAAGRTNAVAAIAARQMTDCIIFCFILLAMLWQFMIEMMMYFIPADSTRQLSEGGDRSSKEVENSNKSILLTKE